MRDHQHIPALRDQGLQSGGQDLGEVVARVNGADPGQGEDLKCHRLSIARASVAALARSAIRVSSATTLTPSMSPCIVAVRDVDHQRVDQALVGGDHGIRPGSKTQIGHHDIGRPFQGPTADQWADRDHMRVPPHGLPDRLDCEDRPDRKRGIGGPDHQEVGAVDRLDDAGGGRGVRITVESELLHMVAVTAIHEILPKGESSPVRCRDHRANRVIGGRQHRRANREACADGVGHLGQGVTLGQAVAAIDLESQVEIAELKSVLDTESGQFGVGNEGVIGPPPSMWAFDSGQRVDHRVEVG